MLIYQKTHHVSWDPITFINVLPKNRLSLDLCLLSSSDVHEILPTEKKSWSNIWVLIIFSVELSCIQKYLYEKRKRGLKEYPLLWILVTWWWWEWKGDKHEWLSPSSMLVSKLFLFQLSMKAQLTVKKKGNFSWTRLRIITWKGFSEALRNCSARWKLKAHFWDKGSSKWHTDILYKIYQGHVILGKHV